MSNCETCKEKDFEIKQPADIIASIYERTVKRLWITILILIFLLVGSNCAWLWWSNQWETVENTAIETEQDGSGTNIVGGGDINYGAEGENN